ncbi:MAG: hypothetical protein SFX18_11060 [Pirellulales bacterium]|nr:hypothetical protein [Pirellulales bacterium]
MLRCLNLTAIGLCVFGLAGCAKDPQSEKQDVRQAEVDAKKKMLDKQNELQNAKEDATTDVRQAQQNANEKIVDKQQELQEAQRAEAEKIQKEKAEAANAVPNQNP